MKRAKKTTPPKAPLRLEMVRAGDLKDNPANWRRHPPGQLSALRNLIADPEIGWAAPLLYNERTKRLIDGHARKRVVGPDEFVPVLIGSWSEEAEKKILATLDPLASMAEADPAALQALLAEVDLKGPDLEALAADLEELLADAEVGGGEGSPSEENEPPALPEKAVSKMGDLWILDEHRLMCGDVTKAEDAATVLSKQSITVVFTSPPYASQRVYDIASGFQPIPPEEYVAWWANVQGNIATHFAPDGSLFINIKESCEEGERQLYVKDLVIAHVRQWNWRFVDEFCWTHGGTPRAVVRRFKNGWEPVFHFARGEHKFRPDAVMHESESAILGFKANRQVGKSGHPCDQKKQGKQYHRPKGASEGMAGMAGLGDAVGAREAGLVGDGMAYPSNVLSVGKNREALGHPAAFPVELPAFFIKAYSDQEDLVLDPFLGSGTTLIAAEQLGRRCYGMEISPRYVDVAVRRWQTLTGKEAVLEGTKKTFAQIERERAK